MFKTLGTVAAFALLTSATWFGLGMDSTANAWLVSHNAKVYCNSENRITFDWSFTNTEPNDDKYAMDVKVTEVISGQNVTKTVHPGEKVSGTFNTDFTEVSSWRIKFDTTWANGRVGTHQFGIEQPRFACEQPPKQIEVCRDGAVITINEDDRKSTDTDAPCPVPEKIDVCRDGKVITINEDDRKSTDTDAPCPVPEKIDVCRDGKVITINEDDRKSTDTDAPCPVPEEKEFLVCRDDKEIMITESEYLSTDIKGECPEVQGEVTELPNTGASAIATTLLGVSTAVSGAYGYIRSRKQ